MRQLIRGVSWLAAVTVVAKALGFAREAVVAAAFGARPDVDALQIALMLPNVLYSLFAGAVLGSALLPAYRRVAAQSGWAQADRVASIALNYAVLALVIVVALTMAGADLIVSVSAPGFDRARHEAAVSLLRVSALLMLPFSVSAVLSGALNARLRFVSPVMADVAINLVALVVVWAGGRTMGVAAVVVGYLSGAILSAALLAAYLRRCGFDYSFSWDWRAAGISQVVALSIPVVLGNVAGQTWIVAERAFASVLPVGALSLLGYATRLQQLPLAIAGLAIATVALPHLAESAAREDSETFSRQVNGALRLTLLLLIPVCIGVACFSTDLVSLAFHRGAFGLTETIATAALLKALAPSILAGGIIALFGRAFFALGDPWPPLAVGVGLLIANGAIDWLLLPRFGVLGLAAGYSAAQLLGCVAMAAVFRQRHPRCYAAPAVTGVAVHVAACLAIFATAVWIVRPAIAAWIPSTPAPVVGMAVAGFSTLACATLLRQLAAEVETGARKVVW